MKRLNVLLELRIGLDDEGQPVLYDQAGRVPTPDGTSLADVTRIGAAALEQLASRLDAAPGTTAQKIEAIYQDAERHRAARGKA